MPIIFSRSIFISLSWGLLAATVAPSAAQYICTPPNTEAETSVSSALTQRMELAGLEQV